MVEVMLVPPPHTILIYYILRYSGERLYFAMTKHVWIKLLTCVLRISLGKKLEWICGMASDMTFGMLFNVMRNAIETEWFKNKFDQGTTFRNIGGASLFISLIYQCIGIPFMPFLEPSANSYGHLATNRVADFSLVFFQNAMIHMVVSIYTLKLCIWS